MAVTATPANGECFIIMPITVPDHLLETYGSDKNHFTDVLKHLFEPAVTLAGFKPVPPVVGRLQGHPQGYRRETPQRQYGPL